METKNLFKIENTKWDYGLLIILLFVLIIFTVVYPFSNVYIQYSILLLLALLFIGYCGTYYNLLKYLEEKQ